MRTTPINSGFTIVNGTGSGSNGERINVWAEYFIGSQSAANNTTNVTVYFYAALAPGYSSTTENTTGLYSALKVDGVAGTGVNNGSYNFSSTSNIHTLGQFQGAVAHRTDGTKSIAINGSFTTKSSYISGGSVSCTVTLPTIARASSVGATDASIGQTAMIAIGTKSSAFTHTLAYTFGQLSGYINASGATTTQAVKITGTAVAFSVPESFYAQIPNAATGVCTLTCTTYQGSSVVGSPQTGTFTVSAKNAKPQISGSITDIASATLALTGNAAKLIRYHSTARCVANAQAKKSATVKKTTINGISGSTLDIPNYDGTAPVFAMTDSRGYTAQATCTPSMILYNHLTVTPSVKRDSPTGDTATLTLSGKCFDGSFGAQNNALTITYQIDNKTAVDISNKVTLQNGKYHCSVSLTNLPYTASHKVRITIKDKLETLTRQLTLQKGMPVFHWGENDFAFHVPVACNEGMNGLYFDNIWVWESKTFRIRSRFDGPEDAGSRETIFLTGTAQSTPITGLITIWNTGNIQWSGTQGVTVSQMETDGYFTVTLPNLAYDKFMMISTTKIRKG